MLKLRIVMLVRQNDTRMVGRFDLSSDYGLEQTWSLAMPLYEWMILLWSLVRMQNRYFKVSIVDGTILGEPEIR